VAAGAEAARRGSDEHVPSEWRARSADDENYELALDEATGFYGMRRKVDAPPLVLPPAPAVMDIHEQILAEQADRVAFCAAVAHFNKS